MKYPAVIEGKDFNRLTYEEVIQIKVEAGRIAQHGIKYLDENRVVLTSNTLEDLNDAWMLNDMCWAHSSSPNRVRNGTTVFVVPNGHLMSTVNPSEIFGLRFTAIGAPTRKNAAALNWTSDQ